MTGERDRPRQPAATGMLRLLSVVPARLDPILPPNLDPRPKVFGIGFHKTGTTSLGRALRRLGYRIQKGFSINRPGKRVRIDEPVTLEKIRAVAFPMVPYYGAFEDNPWPLLFKQADQEFPGSKFVLTVREPDKWVRSAVNHFKERTTVYLDLIHDQPGFSVAGNPDEAVARYLRHIEDVKSHFSGRENDLLVWDIEADPSWRQLCAFLGYDEPDESFPHGKKSEYQDA